MNIATILSHTLLPVTVPSVENIIANTAPVISVRARQEKDPFNSTQQTASAVSAIHVTSFSLPVARPHIMGNVPDKAIRRPQLIRGSKLSSCMSLLSRLYDFK